MKAEKSLVVGTLAAIGASVCCIGPLILLLLGVGGAWIGDLIALERYRPLFIGLTLIFFGLAFRQLYLVPQVCTPGAVCAAPIALTRQRIIFWIAAASMSALLAAPTLAILFI
jgi:mercuric ion transport protein